MVLFFVFLCVAIISALAGFGGGSSYIAILVLQDTPIEHIPIIALMCNLMVVTGASWYYLRAKHIKWRLITPLLLASIPMAYLGGVLNTPAPIFKLVLALSLLVSGLLMLIKNKTYTAHTTLKNSSVLTTITVGGLIGFLAGMVGIGGGIFLSPLIYLFRWAYPKQIAACCTVFIFANSLSGLIAHLQKQTNFNVVYDNWPLLVAVLIGGQLGSYFTAFKLPQRVIAGVAAAITLYASLQLLNNLYKFVG